MKKSGILEKNQAEQPVMAQSNWETKFFCETGSRHRRSGLKCQDSVHSIRRGDVCAVALADGSGGSDLAALGSKTTAETAAELLAEHFEELYRMPEAEIRYNLIIQIREELYRICRNYHTEIEEVKSTLLVFAVDSATGRFVLAHLGDGCIGIQNGAQRQIVSWPVNGISRSYTVLTSTVPVTDRIQIRRGILDEKISAVYLFSDGWGENAASCEQQLACAAGQIDDGRETEGYSDDVGVIALMKQDKKIQ